MALMTSLWSCDSKKAETTADATFTIDTALTADEISKGILTPEIMWKFGRVGNPALSPDGKTLAYTITYYNLKDNKGVTDLFVIPTAGGSPLKLTDEKGSESNPQWSADGKTIWFLSDRSGKSQLWSIAANGEDLKQVSEIDSDINGFWMSPQGDKILYSMDVKVDSITTDRHPDMPKANVRIIDQLMYRHWNYWEDGSYSHIFVASVENGKIGDAKDINEKEAWDTPMATDFDIAEVQWSPDGKSIAYATKKLVGKEYAVSTNSEIYIYSLETGETKNITEGNMGYDRNPSYSPDGKYLAWWSMEKNGYESDQKRLFVMDLATGTKTYLTEGFD